MALGRVREVVYLQTDPGMYLIGNILRRLTEGTKLEAPQPISADRVGLRYFGELDAAFSKFGEELAERPFFIPKKGKDGADKSGAAKDVADGSASITSFLCTEMAQEIYGRGAAEFESLVGGLRPLEHSTCLPVDRTGEELPDALTNEEVVREIEMSCKHSRSPTLGAQWAAWLAGVEWVSLRSRMLSKLQPAGGMRRRT